MEDFAGYEAQAGPARSTSPGVPGELDAEDEELFSWDEVAPSTGTPTGSRGSQKRVPEGDTDDILEDDEVHPSQDEDPPEEDEEEKELEKQLKELKEVAKTLTAAAKGEASEATAGEVPTSGQAAGMTSMLMVATFQLSSLQNEIERRRRAKAEEGQKGSKENWKLVKIPVDKNLPSGLPTTKAW